MFHAWQGSLLARRVDGSPYVVRSKDLVRRASLEGRLGFAGSLSARRAGRSSATPCVPVARNDQMVNDVGSHVLPMLERERVADDELDGDHPS